MGSTRICTCWHKYGQTTTIIYCLLLILFASTSSIFSTHSAFMAQGRPISDLIEVSDLNNNKGVKEEEGSSSVLVGGKYQMIGSRPPRCDRRCSTCGKCVAVQVPVVPQISHIRRSHSNSARRARAATTYSSRGDDLSNYKPMSWKCKCGDYFFNP